MPLSAVWSCSTFSLDTEFVGALILDFPASNTVRNRFLLFVSHPVWNMVRAAPKGWDSVCPGLSLCASHVLLGLTVPRPWLPAQHTVRTVVKGAASLVSKLEQIEPGWVLFHGVWSFSKGCLEGIGHHNLCMQESGLSAGWTWMRARKHGSRIIPLPSIPGRNHPRQSGPTE